MLGAFQAQLQRLLRQSDDPLGLITPDQLKAVLKSIEGKYNTLRDENKRLKAQVSELREGNDHLEQRLHAQSVELDRERTAPRPDPEELQRQRAEFALVQQASEALREQLASSEEAIARLESELRASEEGTEAARAELLAAHATADTLRNELAKSQAACDAWRLELHEVRNDSARLMDETGEATLRLEAAEDELKEVREELATAREALADRDRELAAFRKTTISPLEHETLGQERDALKQRLAAVETRLRQEEAARDALRGELDNSRHHTQVIAATTDIKIQERIASLDQEKVTLRNQLESAHAETDRLRKELHGAVQSAFKPSAAPKAVPKSHAPKPANAEERRKLLAQLINGQNP
ncbi:MAG TPA: hypothetical protein V6D00_13085 [Pantanalinema sp.]